MSIGPGVLLFVIGASPKFALNIQLAWADLPPVGNILMYAGVVFVLGLIFTFRRRHSSSTRRTAVEPA